jgi:predicted molibdopterin-dependent oxidoreductase YjgC
VLLFYNIVILRGQTTQVIINKKQVQLPDNISIFDAIKSVHETVLAPQLGEAENWIHNPSCPLMGLAEVDGKLVSLPALKKRKAQDGMSIETNSQQAKQASHNAHICCLISMNASL